MGDHDKTWKLQTRTHTKAHSSRAGVRWEPRSSACSGQTLLPSHLYPRSCRPPEAAQAPESPRWAPPLLPASPLTAARTHLLRRLCRWWLFLFHLPTITGPGGGTRVPLPLTAIPGPFSFPLPPPSAALVFRPGHVSLLHQPLLSCNLAVRFLQVSERYHFFLKLLL